MNLRCKSIPCFVFTYFLLILTSSCSCWTLACVRLESSSPHHPVKVVVFLSWFLLLTQEQIVEDDDTWSCTCVTADWLKIIYEGDLGVKVWKNESTSTPILQTFHIPWNISFTMDVEQCMRSDFGQTGVNRLEIWVVWNLGKTRSPNGYTFGTDICIGRGENAP